MHSDDSNLVGAATLLRPEEDNDLSARPWNPHPSFAGVSLKHLVTGADTGGALSTHLVRIERGCCLEAHTHPGSLELHEVAAGQGQCTMADRTVRYQPGACGLIPAGTRHSVRADAGEDLYLLAKFVPALL